MIDYSALVQPTRVHGSLYSDADVFAEELERIWYRTWVCLGHESEIARPDAFVRKAIGPQELLMTRSAEGLAETAARVTELEQSHRAVCEQPAGWPLLPGDPAQTATEALP